MQACSLGGEFQYLLSPPPTPSPTPIARLDCHFLHLDSEQSHCRYLRVWLWHFTPQASKLPGSRGFGWFTRYLTFDSFSLQLLQLIFCCLSKVMPVSRITLLKSLFSLHAGNSNDSDNSCKE